jgi:uncharacterized membrane-anchored protein YhcB (DUF1043 family)
MKTLPAVGLILFLIAPTIQAQLTKEDIREIESIVQRNQKHLREYMDVKFAAQKTEIDVCFEEIDKRLQMLMAFVIALIALITVAIGVPQIIIALRERKTADWQKEIQALREQIESLQGGRIIKP